MNNHGWTSRTVVIERTIEIEVTVKYYKGSPQTMTDPGEPDEYYIEESVNAFNEETVELDSGEQELAIQVAIKQVDDEEYEGARELPERASSARLLKTKNHFRSKNETVAVQQ